MTLEQAKERAREYIRVGDYVEAIMSMASDSSKIEDRQQPGYGEMIGMLSMAFLLKPGGPTREDAVKYVEGCK